MPRTRVDHILFPFLGLNNGEVVDIIPKFTAFFTVFQELADDTFLRSILEQFGERKRHRTQKAVLAVVVVVVEIQV